MCVLFEALGKIPSLQRYVYVYDWKTVVRTTVASPADVSIIANFRHLDILASAVYGSMSIFAPVVDCC